MLSEASNTTFAAKLGSTTTAGNPSVGQTAATLLRNHSERSGLHTDGAKAGVGRAHSLTATPGAPATAANSSGSSSSLSSGPRTAIAAAGAASDHVPARRRDGPARTPAALPLPLPLTTPINATGGSDLSMMMSMAGGAGQMSMAGGGHSLAGLSSLTQLVAGRAAAAAAAAASSSSDRSPGSRSASGSRGSASNNNHNALSGATSFAGIGSFLSGSGGGSASRSKSPGLHSTGSGSRGGGGGGHSSGRSNGSGGGAPTDFASGLRDLKHKGKGTSGASSSSSSSSSAAAAPPSSSLRSPLPPHELSLLTQAAVNVNNASGARATAAILSSSSSSLPAPSATDANGGNVFTRGAKRRVGSSGDVDADSRGSAAGNGPAPARRGGGSASLTSSSSSSGGDSVVQGIHIRPGIIHALAGEETLMGLSNMNGNNRSSSSNSSQGQISTNPAVAIGSGPTTASVATASSTFVIPRKSTAAASATAAVGGPAKSSSSSKDSSATATHSKASKSKEKSAASAPASSASGSVASNSSSSSGSSSSSSGESKHQEKEKEKTSGSGSSSSKPKPKTPSSSSSSSSANPGNLLAAAAATAAIVKSVSSSSASAFLPDPDEEADGQDEGIVLEEGYIGAYPPPAAATVPVSPIPLPAAAVPQSSKAAAPKASPSSAALPPASEYANDLLPLPAPPAPVLTVAPPTAIAGAGLPQLPFPPYATGGISGYGAPLPPPPPFLPLPAAAATSGIGIGPLQFGTGAGTIAGVPGTGISSNPDFVPGTGIGAGAEGFYGQPQQPYGASSYNENGYPLPSSSAAVTVTVKAPRKRNRSRKSVDDSAADLGFDGTGAPVVVRRGRPPGRKDSVPRKKKGEGSNHSHHSGSDDQRQQEMGAGVSFLPGAGCGEPISAVGVASGAGGGGGAGGVPGTAIGGGAGSSGDPWSAAGQTDPLQQPVSKKKRSGSKKSVSWAEGTDAANGDGSDQQPLLAPAADGDGTGANGGFAATAGGLSSLTGGYFGGGAHSYDPITGMPLPPPSSSSSFSAAAGAAGAMGGYAGATMMMSATGEGTLPPMDPALQLQLLALQHQQQQQLQYQFTGVNGTEGGSNKPSKASKKRSRSTSTAGEFVSAAASSSSSSSNDKGEGDEAAADGNSSSNDSEAAIIAAGPPPPPPLPLSLPPGCKLRLTSVSPEVASGSVVMSNIVGIPLWRLLDHTRNGQKLAGPLRACRLTGRPLSMVVSLPFDTEYPSASSGDSSNSSTNYYAYAVPCPPNDRLRGPDAGDGIYYDLLLSPVPLHSSSSPESNPSSGDSGEDDSMGVSSPASTSERRYVTVSLPSNSPVAAMLRERTFTYSSDLNAPLEVSALLVAGHDDYYQQPQGEDGARSRVEPPAEKGIQLSLDAVALPMAQALLESQWRAARESLERVWGDSSKAGRRARASEPHELYPDPFASPNPPKLTVTYELCHVPVVKGPHQLVDDYSGYGDYVGGLVGDRDGDVLMAAAHAASSSAGEEIAEQSRDSLAAELNAAAAGDDVAVPSSSAFTSASQAHLIPPASVPSTDEDAVAVAADTLLARLAPTFEHAQVPPSFRQDAMSHVTSLLTALKALAASHVQQQQARQALAAACALVVPPSTQHQIPEQQPQPALLGSQSTPSLTAAGAPSAHTKQSVEPSKSVSDKSPSVVAKPAAAKPAVTPASKPTAPSSASSAPQQRKDSVASLPSPPHIVSKAPHTSAAMPAEANSVAVAPPVPPTPFQLHLNDDSRFVVPLSNLGQPQRPARTTAAMSTSFSVAAVSNGEKQEVKSDVLVRPASGSAAPSPAAASASAVATTPAMPALSLHLQLNDDSRFVAPLSNIGKPHRPAAAMAAASISGPTAFTALHNATVAGGGKALTVGGAGTPLMAQPAASASAGSSSSTAAFQDYEDEAEEDEGGSRSNQSLGSQASSASSPAAAAAAGAGSSDNAVAPDSDTRLSTSSGSRASASSEGSAAKRRRISPMLVKGPPTTLGSSSSPQGAASAAAIVPPEVATSDSTSRDLFGASGASDNNCNSNSNSNVASHQQGIAAQSPAGSPDRENDGTAPHGRRVIFVQHQPQQHSISGAACSSSSASSSSSGARPQGSATASSSTSVAAEAANNNSSNSKRRITPVPLGGNGSA